MKTEPKFFRCSICGNLVGLIHSGGGTLVCCGQEMVELTPNTVDAATEKHVPVFEQDGAKVTVKVGSVEHPMLEEHHIEWIYLNTSKGGQRKNLTVGKPPVAEFLLAEGEELISVFEYCNLHGLWSAKA
ncbi:MAG: desulfoferrodoxin family protein [Acetanaerobacterium sp.]